MQGLTAGFSGLPHWSMSSGTATITVAAEVIPREVSCGHVISCGHCLEAVEAYLEEHQQNNTHLHYQAFILLLHPLNQCFKAIDFVAYLFVDDLSPIDAGEFMFHLSSSTGEALDPTTHVITIQPGKMYSFCLL